MWEIVGLKSPLLKKVAIAALGCFHGLTVESSFNHMKDIIDNKAGSMEITTFSSVQSVSSCMSRKQFKLLNRFFHINDSANRVPRDNDSFDPIFKVRTLYHLSHSAQFF